MREFFVLSYDTHDGQLETVTDYEMDDFDLTAFWSGRRFDGVIPSAVRIWTRRGEPTDHLGNPLSWVIVSDRLWGIIRPLAEEDCQVVPIPLLYENSNIPVPGYVLLNAIRRIPAATEDRNDADIMISDLAFDTSQIPPSVHIFRVTQSPTVTIISDAVVKVLWGKRTRGIAFLRTKSC